VVWQPAEAFGLLRTRSHLREILGETVGQR
jgi:hypothetical protein